MPDLDPTELSKIPPDRQIDVVADAFLESWKNGGRPLVSEYASLVDGSIRNQALRELILTEQQLQLKQSALEAVPILDENTTLRGDHKTAKQQSAMPVQIGPYRPQYTLGHGASGVVYAATELETGRMVAVKSPHAHLMAGKEDAKRFLREARYAAQLKHRGIVEFLHLGQTQSGPYLVYEFLNGVDLCSYLKANVPLTLEAKLKWIADVAKALQYAHDNLLVHRDLKPSNLMVVFPADTADLNLSASIEIKILDFGIARLLDAATILTNDGEMLGTPAYMSPEQASGQSQKADHRADIYSLGVILYELLTGATPFKGTASELVNQICSQEVPMLRSTHPSISAPVATICQRCLRLNPAYRYKEIVQVAEDIERFLRGEPILAKPVGLIERARSKWRQLELAQVVATALVAIVATVLVVAFLLTRPAAPSPIQSWIASMPGSLRNGSALSMALPRASVDDIANLLELPSPQPKEILEVLENQLKADRLGEKEKESTQILQCLLEPERATTPEQVAATVNWICELLTEADEVQRGRFLTKLPLQWIEALEKSYRLKSVPAKRIVLAQLLASFHRDDPEKSSALLGDAQPDEILVWSKELGHSNWNHLSIDWELFETGVDYQNFNEAFCIQQANRVFTRYALGDTDCLLKAMEDRSDPRLRTYCVHRFKESGIAIAPLISRILSDRIQSDVLYGLLMIVAVTESNIVNPNTLTQLEDWVIRQYESHSDSGVHAMCRYLVAKWQLQDALERVDQRLMQIGIVRDKQWFVNSLGMHLAIISGKVRFWRGRPDGETPEVYPRIDTGRMESIEGAYAIGMDEVTFEQYQKYKPDVTSAVSTQFAVCNVSWIEGMAFCNRLNKQEMLAEIPLTVTLAGSNPKITFEIPKSAKQYRLPTSEEWEYASRAHTVTPRFHGTVDTPFSNGVLSENNSEQILPNRWGLKNTLASQAEWTMTREPSYDASNPSQVEYFIVRDQSVELQPKSRTNSFVSTVIPIGDSKGLGMRVVLRLPDFD